MEDDRKAFLAERKARLAYSAPDERLRKASSDFFLTTVVAKYSYNFDWLGVPIIQYPQDIVAMQEIVWRVKPDLVIETGVARGGSIIFYVSMMKLLGKGGRVVGVDIDIRPHNRDSIESHPLADCVSLIEGSSIDPDTVAKVAEHAKSAKRPLVILDSHHTHDHVLKELEMYSPFVKAGSYLVVFDTGVEVLPPELIVDRPWGPGDNPMTAVREFLSKNDRFEIDREVDAKLLVSVAPEGYLKCIRD